MALTGRLAVLAAVVAGSFLAVPGVDRRAFWLANAALLALAALDLALAASVRRLALARSGATSVRLGEAAVVLLTVANGSGRTARLSIRDAWPPSAGATPRVHRVRVPGGERRRLTTELLPTRRGDRRPERVTVRSAGPLGLAARQGRHVAPWQVRVLPPFTSRKFLPERLNRLRQLDGAVLVRGRGQGTEFDSLREYVGGDDVRSIDWRATARRDTVVVRTWRPERDRRVVIVLDTGRTSAGRVGDTPRLDHALDAALLLAALASRAGDQVELLAYDRVQRARVSGGSRADVLPRLVNAMATLEPVLLEADHQGIVAAVLRRVRRRALVVLFTELNTAVVEEGLLPNLGPLTSRHTVVVASVADPRVGELLHGRGSARAVYGAAAAERATAERRRLVALLRRRGVEVVDAAPESFAPSVADAYLALKAEGRL
ncbi:MAG: hypothetical protein QOE45_1003 [Frankiaceae bacterium]|jgi:uncharacterized protein (DUF58 family)|nr:hypothetical protein [Frankiaceae bacterium]